MTSRVFVDTNVLLYQWDSSEPSKQRRATTWMEALWNARRGRLSVQVLSEFYVAATQKLQPALEREVARRYARTLMAWEPIASDPLLLESAWRAQDRFRLSWRDALIVAAAERAGCGALLSEDFQDGQAFDGLLVLDPFRHEPAA